MAEEQPQTQPTPPERPIFNPETLKEEIAGKEGVKEKIDTLNETLEAIKEAKKEALEDIKADIARVYPDETPEGETKRAQEYKAVEKMLSRLEAGYLQAAKESKAEIKPGDEALYEFNDLIDKYFKELRTITGDTNPEEGKIDFSTVDPYEFWKNTAGWYEKAEDEKTPGTESFKEDRIEEEGARWQDAIRDFQALDKKGNPTNKIKEGEEENFQAWIETHREDLRRIILRQIADRKYIIDFANLTGVENPTKEDIDAAIADSASKASFIAKNIGLADLFADISQAITVWKGDKLYTGQINTDYNRKNGLKGGYFYNDGKDHYLEIWHGAVISTNPADQIAEDVKDLLPNDMFEESKEEITPRDPSSFPVEQQPKGEQVVKLTYKPTKNVQTVGPERAKLIEESVKKRKQILTPDGENTFEVEYKYEKLYGGDTITTPGKTTFELQKPQPEFTDVNAELVYKSKEFPNVEITIPYNKDNSFLLRVKTTKEERDYPRATIYEFENLDALKQKLGEEIGKPEVANKQNGTLKDDEIPVVELDESCSKETTEKYLNNIDKDGFYPLVVSKPGKVIVHSKIPGDNVKVEGKIEKEKTKLTDSDLTPEGIEELPIEETTEELDLSGCTVTKESLEKLLAKAPKVKKISFDHSKLNPGDKILFTVADKLNGTLEELDLTGAAYDTEDLQYLQSCPKLTTLKLGSSELIGDFEIEAYVSKLVNLKSLTLASTSITDKSLEFLAKLENLGSREEEGLDLKGTDTSYRATMELKKKLPSCNIKVSERAERELDELIKEKLEEIAKSYEPKLAEDINRILGGDKTLSVQNTNFNPEKQSIGTDVYFEKEKIASAELRMKVTDEKDEKEISLEDLYEDLSKTGDIHDLYKKLETEDISGGKKMKYKVTIGKKVMHIEKIFKFTDKDEKEIETEKVQTTASNLKTKKKEREEKLDKPEIDAVKGISDTFGSNSGITFEKSHSDIDNVAQGFLTYKEKVIGQLQIDFTDPDKPKYIYLKYTRDNVAKATPEEMKENCKKVDAEIAKKETENKEKETKEALEKRKEAIRQTLQTTLETIDKDNLKLSLKSEKEQEYKGKKYLRINFTYFGETVGMFDYNLEKDSKELWILDTEEYTKLDPEKENQPSPSNATQTIIDELIEKRKEQKIEEFKKIIAKVQDKKNKDNNLGSYILSLDEENAETLEADTRRPYLKIKISARITDIDMAAAGTGSTSYDKDICFIEDWLVGEPEISINEEKTEKGKVEEKIASLF